MHAYQSQFSNVGDLLEIVVKCWDDFVCRNVRKSCKINPETLLGILIAKGNIKIGFKQTTSFHGSNVSAPYFK